MVFFFHHYELPAIEQQAEIYEGILLEARIRVNQNNSEQHQQGSHSSSPDGNASNTEENSSSRSSQVQEDQPDGHSQQTVSDNLAESELSSMTTTTSHNSSSSNSSNSSTPDFPFSDSNTAQENTSSMPPMARFSQRSMSHIAPQGFGESTGRSLTHRGIFRSMSVPQAPSTPMGGNSNLFATQQRSRNSWHRPSNVFRNILLNFRRMQQTQERLQAVWTQELEPENTGPYRTSSVDSNFEMVD